MDNKIEKAELMLDMKAFLGEFYDYSPDMADALDSRAEEMKDAYKDLSCSGKIIAAAKSYILKKYEEHMIREGYYRKIEHDFFDKMVSVFCDGAPVPDQKEYLLPLASDASGYPKRYTHFEADKIIPFITNKLTIH